MYTVVLLMRHDDCYAPLSENSQNFQKFNDPHWEKLKQQINIIPLI